MPIILIYIHVDGPGPSTTEMAGRSWLDWGALFRAQTALETSIERILRRRKSGNRRKPSPAFSIRKFRGKTRYLRNLVRVVFLRGSRFDNWQQLSRLVHFHDNVATTNQLPFHKQLREGWPVRKLGQISANLRV